MIKKNLGTDNDRANIWEITCECGHKFKPPTTFLRRQWVSCPKCGKSETVDYNKEGDET
jgi:hypothetical protein